MKKLISETDDGYRIYASLSQISNPNGYYVLKVTSQWDNAKNPEAEQTTVNALLSPDALRAYQQLFTEAVNE